MLRRQQPGKNAGILTCNLFRQRGRLSRCHVYWFTLRLESYPMASPSGQVAEISVHVSSRFRRKMRHPRTKASIEGCFLPGSPLWSLACMTTASVLTFERFVSQSSDLYAISQLTESQRHAPVRHSQAVTQPHFLFLERRHPIPAAAAAEDKPSSWEEAWIDLGGEG